jgi:hypothetical protein
MVSIMILKNTPSRSAGLDPRHMPGKQANPLIFQFFRFFFSEIFEKTAVRILPNATKIPRNSPKLDLDIRLL